MTPAATTTGGEQKTPAPRRRRAQGPVTRRAGIQLLAGLLIVGAIPVLATVRILEENAIRNERAQADSALRLQLQTALRDLHRLGDDASTHADDLARSPAVQRAFISMDRAAIRRLAVGQRGVAFYLGESLVAGQAAGAGIKQSVRLTVNGRRIGELVATVPLDAGLAARLAQDAPHAHGDRLVIVQHRLVPDTRQKVVTQGQTVHLGGESYRALLTRVPDAAGMRLLALRPERAINASVAPYRQRIRYAAIGSFALLVLVALAFAGPIVRVLGDFRRVASQATTDGLTGIANRRSFETAPCSSRSDCVINWPRSASSFRTAACSRSRLASAPRPRTL